MMLISGGCYIESCDEPHWSQFYGSGGRAAAALAGRTPSIELITYSSEAFSDLLQMLAATYGFKARSEPSPYSISFQYHHPLAPPVIRPPLNKIQPLAPLELAGDTILRFGFLEGDAIVRGSYVIYDPQSAFDPRPFAENGSEAEHLAVVCNMAEARRLTGTEAVDAAAPALLRNGADVVVIKMGSAGAHVQTNESSIHIPAFKTSHVWSVGSGDVFAAVFAHEWGIAHKSPTEAAEIASRATAFYCDTKTLPIPDLPELSKFQPIRQVARGASKLRVYLAGPFFTIAQRWLVTEVRRYLNEQGVEVFSPFHDVGPGPAADVVPQDIEAIKSSSAVLAILDGLDAGTLFEVGFARALGIPVVGFVQAETEESMKMLDGTGCLLCNELVTAVYQAVWAASNG